MRGDFERAFSDFIDRSEYDQAEATLFCIVRQAFRAGWMAAGGIPPASQRVVELVKLREGRAEGPEADS